MLAHANTHGAACARAPRGHHHPRPAGEKTEPRGRGRLRRGGASRPAPAHSAPHVAHGLGEPPAAVPQRTLLPRDQAEQPHEDPAPGVCPGPGARIMSEKRSSDSEEEQTDRRTSGRDTQSEKTPPRGPSGRSRALPGRRRPAKPTPHRVTSEEVGLQYPAPKTRFSRERPDCSGPASTPPLPSHGPLPGRVKLEERMEGRSGDPRRGTVPRAQSPGASAGSPRDPSVRRGSSSHGRCLEGTFSDATVTRGCSCLHVSRGAEHDARPTVCTKRRPPRPRTGLPC